MPVLAESTLVQGALALPPVAWLGWCVALWLLAGRRAGPPGRPRLTLGAIAAAGAVTVLAGWVVLLAAAVGADALLDKSTLDGLSAAQRWWAGAGLAVACQSLAAWAWLVGKRRRTPLSAGRAAAVAGLGGALALAVGVLIQALAVAVALIVVLAVCSPALYMMVGEARRRSSPR